MLLIYKRTWFESQVVSMGMVVLEEEPADLKIST
jgi:hypothetical protein